MRKEYGERSLSFFEERELNVFFCFIIKVIGGGRLVIVVERG